MRESTVVHRRNLGSFSCDRHGDHKPALCRMLCQLQSCAGRYSCIIPFLQTRDLRVYVLSRLGRGSVHHESQHTVRIGEMRDQ